MRATDSKSPPQIHINLTFLLRTLCGDQVNPESRSRESAQGESRLADELCKVTSKAQSLYIKERFGKGTQRNMTDFFKASITTDSIKIFSTTFCTLVTVTALAK